MCAIAITSVVSLVSTRDSPATILVRGTATGSLDLRVRLQCAGKAVTKAASVDNNGNWAVRFTTADGLPLTERECQGIVDVHAESSPDSACWDNWRGSVLRQWAELWPPPVDPIPTTIPDPDIPPTLRIGVMEADAVGIEVEAGPVERVKVLQPACPSISFLRIEIGSQNPDDTRDVHVAATVALPFPDTLVARLRNARTGEVLSVLRSDTGTLKLIDDRPYPEGSHTVVVDVLFPSGCPPAAESFEVEIQKGRTAIGVTWMLLLAAFLVILAIETGFLASALALGIATLAMAIGLGGIIPTGAHNWARWTLAGVGLALLVMLFLYIFSDWVTVSVILLAAVLGATGFFIGAAAAWLGSARASE